MNRLVGLLALLLLAACAAPRRSEAIVGPHPLNEEEHRGAIAFMRACNACHPGAEAGVGGSLTKPLPAFGIKTKVRTGIGGDMPKFNDQELSDADLDAIVRYLARVRKTH